MTSQYGENPTYAFLRDASMNSIAQKSEKSSDIGGFSLEKVGEGARKGKAVIKRVANRIALNMARLGTVRDGETQEAMAERLREEILSRSAFADKKAARKTAKEARGVEREALSLSLLNYIENYTKCKFCII